jgi:hypothetical protein
VRAGAPSIGSAEDVGVGVAAQRVQVDEAVLLRVGLGVDAGPEEDQQLRGVAGFRLRRKGNRLSSPGILERDLLDRVGKVRRGTSVDDVRGRRERGAGRGGRRPVDRRLRQEQKRQREREQDPQSAPHPYPIE